MQHHPVVAALAFAWIAGACGGQTFRADAQEGSGAEPGDAGVAARVPPLGGVDSGACRDRACDPGAAPLEPDPNFVPNGPSVICESSSECVLVPVDCCGPCESPLPSAFLAKNARGAEEFNAAHCAGATCYCEPAVHPYVAVCTERYGACALADATSLPGTWACTDDADCRVRSVECCECGADTDPGKLVAVSDDTAYREQVCSAFEPCALCEPSYPEGVLALCSAGRCVVADPR